jgi:hypothetical protein
MRDPFAENQDASAMRDWASSAPPTDLAVELMGAFDGVRSLDELRLMSWLCFGDYEIRGRNYADDSNKELWRSVQEALQLLANSELILSSGGDIFYWRATRSIGGPLVSAWRPGPTGRMLSGNASRTRPACS